MEQCFKKSALMHQVAVSRDLAAIVTVTLVSFGSAVASVFLL